ncbi:hypothetical protein [Polaromonas sp. AER18D-145]|uniref:hypothetical protein n=1 Tax=Polaromonas sp. AER18D-145 TaxID=1977060 RepID=UPI00352AA893
MGAGGGAKEEFRKEARRPGFRAGVFNGAGAAAMLAGLGGVFTAGATAVLVIVLIMTFSSGLAGALPFTDGGAGLVTGLAALTAGLTIGAGLADFTALTAGRLLATGAGFFATGAALGLAPTLALATALGLVLEAAGAGFFTAVFEAAGLTATLVVGLALPADVAFPADLAATLDFFA